MKRIISSVLALCILLTCAAIFVGCNKESGGEWPVTVREVTISKEPKNIVVLNDGLADIISYIGYDIKMVGRSSECDQDFLYVVPVMGTAAEPDVEAIKAAEADLVIADSTLSETARKSLEGAKITVLTLDNPANGDDLLALYTDLGTALGGKTTGSKKGEDGYFDLFEMLNTLKTAARSDILHTTTYLYLDENGQLCTFVNGSLEHKIFGYNGGANVLANQSTPVVTPSDLHISSPNFIFYDTPEVLTYLSSNEELANINGLENGTTLQIPKKLFSRFGTTAEDTVYQMLNFIEVNSKSTPDEAAAETQAAAATEAETAAAATDA